MKTSDENARRNTIIKAAIECYSKHGIGQTKMNEIARLAKVKPSHLSYYFEDFFALMNAVVEYLREDLQKISRDAVDKFPQDAKKGLYQYASETLGWAIGKPKYFSVWMYFYHESTHRQEFSKLNQLGRKTGRERISLMLYRMIESKQLVLREGDTVANLAYMIQTTITGYSIMVATEPDVDPKKVRDLMIAQINFNLGIGS